jgi:hypothetical protein
VNHVVGARPEVAAEEAILGLRPATEDERTDTAQMATATLNPTAARLQGGGSGVAAADAIRNTNAFMSNFPFVIAIIISFSAWLCLFLNTFIGFQSRLHEL